jgi:pSer/pThr/pTyr-binding forkhead associated (FHA) protein
MGYPPARGGFGPRLIERKPDGREFDLNKDRVTIGRHRDSDVFLEDLAVSRLHVTINRDGSGRYILRDENSANGVYVNGQRVAERVLQEGDEVQIGQTVLVFHES